jgi:hypothetical protein
MYRNSGSLARSRPGTLSGTIVGCSGRFGDEAEKLRIELQAPSQRGIALEDATVERTADVRRLVLATAGTFVGTFAVILLAFAMPRFRVRRIDPSADE